jgi:amidase
VATTQITAAYDPTTDTPVINGSPVDPYSGWFLTSLFSLLNWMPVINVPSGIASNNIPTGIQIATRPYDDVAAAEIAANYSRIAPAIHWPAMRYV